MSSTVRISWTMETDNGSYWNEVCAWSIERYGLPGDRFESHANIHYMDFIFKSNKDALMMAIMWNGEIVSDDRLTVEHIGKFM